MKTKLLVLLLALLLLTACSSEQNETTGSDQGATQESLTEEQSASGEDSEPALTDIPTENELAALAVFGISMEYPDFMLQGVYFDPQADATQGVFAAFESGGITYYAHVYPIAAGRTQSGTRDFYSPEVGYAAFDLVESIDETLTPIEQEAYAEAMNQLSRPSVYTN